MNSFRALLRSCLNAFMSYALAVGIAVPLLISALGPARPARADTPPDPAARLQFILHTIHIRDDEDLIGSGELFLFADLCADPGTGPYDRSFHCGPGGSIAMERSFSANSGDDVTLERVVPSEGDFVEGDASVDAGLSVYPGQRYLLITDIFDRDPAYSFDVLGELFIHVDEAHNWGLGTHTARSIKDDGSAGDYDVTFEIRRTPLPDLAVNSVYLQDSAGTPFVCGDIRNIGQQPAPPAELTLSTEGNTVERFRLPALDVGVSYPHCVKRSDLPAKKHNIVFSIDELRELPEMEELNNVGVLTLEAVAAGAGSAAGAPATSANADDSPAASSAPQPKPNQGQGPKPTEEQAGPYGKERADLIVREIRVNGQVPDGKNDCTDGKNTVSVVVKNGGPNDAGSFGVTLAVDDDDEDEAADGLAAGQEREIRFDGVGLKKGRHTLQATVKADRAETDPNPRNNTVKIALVCTGA